MSKGVSILISKCFNLQLISSNKPEGGRIIAIKLKIHNINAQIINVYVPNNSAERKQLIKNLKQILDENYVNIIAGDFNCVNDSIIDRHPSHTTNDHGYNELIKLMNDFRLTEIFRKRHPDKRRFTFCRGQSKSRIDFFLIQNDLDCYVKNVSICYFPYSDHDLVDLKLEIKIVERGVWKMNVSTIKSKNFIESLECLWPIWAASIDESEHT